MKKILFALFSCNLIFFTNPLEAHINQKGMDKGFFIGQMIVYCILESDGVISKSEDQVQNHFLRELSLFSINENCSEVFLSTYFFALKAMLSVGYGQILLLL